ncbi:mate-domain-containing protein [Phascolomyces articulosus]|uniref:Mate-domain-containing protein n=1 Tax=Phascolomyces articulosus TaxID=60185 RepID=A0AAD5JNA0_9FUNG|nr:mate-domain-containing protein [Phascolomyces articulosus]
MTQSKHDIPDKGITNIYSTFLNYTVKDNRKNDNSYIYHREDDDETTGLLNEDFCTKRKQNPESYWSHFQWLFSSIVALVSCKFIGQLARLVTVSAVGHLGSQELAGMSLAQMFESCTTLSLVLGLISALDTLCGQSWTGAKDKTIVGLYLQRSIMVYTAITIPIVICWGICLKLLQYDGNTNEDVIRYAGIYLLFFLPGAIAYAVFHMAASYLQAQGIMRIGAYGALLSLPVTVAANYILVAGKPFELGAAGAALADGASYITTMLIIIGYIVFVTGYQGWSGWDFRNAIRGWGPIIRLMLPSICLHLLHSGIPQLCTFATSRFGASYYLSAHFILLRSSLAFQAFGHGVKHATATRIGNLMGQGSLGDARRAILIGALIAFAIGTASATVLMIYRWDYPYLYTNDDEVARVVSEVIPMVALQLFVLPTSNLGLGICDGLGQQRLSLIMTFVAYFIVGVPACYFFAFTMKWAVFGLWTGLVVAEFSFPIALFLGLWMLDWSKEVRGIKQRIEKEQQIDTMVNH